MEGDTRGLDHEWFELIERRNIPDSNQVIEAYRCKHPANTAILRSVDHPEIPICAITVLPRNSSASSTSFLTRRPSGPDGLIKPGDPECVFFQSMLKSPDEELCFVLTNLINSNNSSHFVKIDILGENIAVNQIDIPTVGVNEWNEISPSESAKIEGDHRFGNRTMKLHGLKRDDGEDITVGDAESQASSQLPSYFYINVLPSTSSPELVSLFEGETVWHCSELFVRQFALSQAQVGLKRRRTTGGRGGRGGSKERHVKRKMMLGRRTNSLPRSYSMLSRSREIKVDASEEEILASQAASIVRGNKVIEVSTQATGASYLYDKAGQRMALGFSIKKDLFTFDPLDSDSLKALAEEYIIDLIEANGKRLHEEHSQMKKYVSEECVICLSEKPTKVLLQCGHQCLCQECSIPLPQICHLCRGRVVGCFDWNEM